MMFDERGLRYPELEIIFTVPEVIGDNRYVWPFNKFDCGFAIAKEFKSFHELTDDQVRLGMSDAWLVVRTRVHGVKLKTGFLQHMEEKAAKNGNPRD